MQSDFARNDWYIPNTAAEVRGCASGVPSRSLVLDFVYKSWPVEEVDYL
jgi:hypothetical protein